MNLNFPARPPEAVTEVEVTRQGFRDIGEMHAIRRTDLRGRDYYWMSFRGSKQDHAEGTDLRAVDEGKISVTPLHIDLTHAPSIHDLKGVLGGAPPKRVTAA
jgi:5'-nucleotidase